MGNPGNTNCLIARGNAPDIPADRWFAMTRLDENRAKSKLAKKAGAGVAAVTNMAIWGNNPASQFPVFPPPQTPPQPAPAGIPATHSPRRRSLSHCQHPRRADAAPGVAPADENSPSFLTWLSRNGFRVRT